MRWVWAKEGRRAEAEAEAVDARCMVEPSVVPRASVEVRVLGPWPLAFMYRLSCASRDWIRACRWGGWGVCEEKGNGMEW